MDDRLDIVVLGGGLMGHAIALTFARAGHRLAVFDTDEAVLASLPQRVIDDLALLGIAGGEADRIVARIEVTDDLAAKAGSADFAIEAVPEKLALKQQVFAELEAVAPQQCIFASNTSVIPIGQIMARLERKERALGTHWWNPGHLMPLVEVISAAATAPRHVERVMALLADAGKTPVHVRKDVPGFIGNRLQHAMWREAVSLVASGVCDADTIDTVVKASFGRRLPVQGPMESMDLIGTELVCDIHDNVLHDLDRSTATSPYLRKLVADGRLGMRSGAGFRSWEADAARQSIARVTEHLQRCANQEHGN